MDIAIMSIYKTEFFDPLKKKRHNRTDAIILKTELVSYYEIISHYRHSNFVVLHPHF